MARYQQAIDWLANNDDTEWVNDPESPISVTGALVADLFGKTDEQVATDVILALKDAAAA